MVLLDATLRGFLTFIQIAHGHAVSIVMYNFRSNSFKKW